jgi:hypothetical protein
METVDSRGKGEEREVKGGGIREMNESRVQRPESAEPERWMDEKEVRKGLKIFKGHQRTEKKDTQQLACGRLSMYTVSISIHRELKYLEPSVSTVPSAGRR